MGLIKKLEGIISFQLTGYHLIQNFLVSSGKESKEVNIPFLILVDPINPGSHSGDNLNPSICGVNTRGKTGPRGQDRG
jgi:hypothetical protein